MGRAKKIITLLGTAILLLPAMVSAQNISADGLGGYWLIDGGRVACVDSHGKRKVSYSELLLGNPTSIDASDPFRILTFYLSTQTLVVLSSEATLIGKVVDLSLHDLGYISSAARSSLGGAWLSAEGTRSIFRLDKQLNRVEQKLVLPVKHASSQVLQMVEHDGMLYVGLDKGIILEYDSYGSLLRELPFKPHDGFLIHGDRIYIKFKGVVEEFSLINPQESRAIYEYDNHVPLVVLGNQLHGFTGGRFILCKKIDG